MSYNSAQGRSNRCHALKPLIVLETASHSTCQHWWSWEKASATTGKSWRWFPCRDSIAQIISAEVLHLHLFSSVFFKISLVCVWTESFCGEDFTAAFCRAHESKRLLGGRRNGNKSREKQRRGESWALTCADTQVSALSFICSLSGLYQRFTSLLNSVISEGEFFLCLLDTGKPTQANSRVGTRSASLHAHSDRLCLEIPSLQFPSPRAAWLRFSEGFGTSQLP